MKIAIVIDSYSTGGVALALKEFLKHMENEPFEITVFIRNIENSDVDTVLKNVSYKKWSEENHFGEVIKEGGLLRGIEFLKNRLMALYYWRNFGKQVIYKTRCNKEVLGEYDCAIAYQMISNDVTIMTLEKIKAKRKILWLHGKKNFKDKDLKFYDDIYSKADSIVCVAKETEDRFKRLMPKCVGKTCTIHNFYDIPAILSKANEPIEEFSNEKIECVIASVGRLSKEKGFDRVPDVVKKLQEDGHKVKWIVVGHGDQYDKLKRQIHKNGQEDCIQLVGYRENPYPYIKNCDIYVQPSYTEGYCTSTMEAKILGKPVVATDISGMREQFVDGETGIIVESSIEGIFKGIKRLIDESELREKIIRNLSAEPITNDKVKEETIKIIRGR